MSIKNKFLLFMAMCSTVSGVGATVAPNNPTPPINIPRLITKAALIYYVGLVPVEIFYAVDSRLAERSKKQHFINKCAKNAYVKACSNQWYNEQNYPDKDNLGIKKPRDAALLRDLLHTIPDDLNKVFNDTKKAKLAEGGTRTEASAAGFVAVKKAAKKEYIELT